MPHRNSVRFELSLCKTIHKLLYNSAVIRLILWQDAGGAEATLFPLILLAMKNKEQNTAGSLSSPDNWLTDHGDYLFRYAMLHLRDEHHAEDAVQETLLAAIQGKKSYTGQSSERTWLVGILKHKIIDAIRKKTREPIMEYIDEQSEHASEVAIDSLFDERGEWICPPQSWGNPEKMLEQKRFWDVFTECLQNLPPQLAMIYSLREISGMSTEDICKDLGITSTNSWVMLHRARLGLKQCFEIHWLGEQKKGKR